jgi:CBS domain-containing protein
MTVHSAPSTASVHHDVSGHLSGSPAATLRPRRLTVEDVMSRDVVTVAPTATFHQMIGLMRKHHVSALPVVGDSGGLLGVVSEADLLPKENPPPPRRRWLPEARQSTERRHKASGASARDVMSTPAISIGRHTVLAAAVRVLEQHGIKRLVVLDAEDQLVGIVSRRDLLAAFSRSDAEIRRDVIEGVIPRWLMIDPAGIRVEVHGGVVRLEGIVDRRSDADILTHLVNGLDGVVDVDSTVNYRWNDRDLALSPELHVS